MGNFFTSEPQICLAEPNYVDKSQEYAQQIQDKIQSDNVYEEIIGHTLEYAHNRFPEYIFRAVSIDGEYFPVHQDYRTNRINTNMETQNGELIIISVQNIG